MEDYNSNNPDSDRKNKQKYLIKHVLEQGYNPEEFSNYLLQARADGQEIDNWTIEELESQVILFKRVTDSNDNDQLMFKMEDICVDTSGSNAYVKQVKTAKKKRTILSDSQPYVMLDTAEVKDGGLFYGKYLCFAINIPEKEIKIKRTEAEFVWLHKGLAKEFPFTPLPPLLRVNEKYFDNESVMATRKNFEKFLNECMRHPELRCASCLEIFLVSQTKAEFDMRVKDFNSFIDKQNLISKSLTKKGCDYNNKDVINMFPTPKGTATLKISTFIDNYVDAAESQYYHYNLLFEQLEKLHVEYDKCQKKMISINQKIKGVFSEFQETALKYNATKPFKSSFTQIEDRIFSTISSYFHNYGKLIREHSRTERGTIRKIHKRLLHLCKGVY